MMYDERDNEKSLQDIIEGQMSIRGLISSYERKTLMYFLNKFKNDMGFVYQLEVGSIRKAIPVLEAFGLKNLFSISKLTGKPNIYGIKFRVSKLAEATYLFAFLNFPEMDHGYMTLYFFGRKSYQYYTMFTNDIRTETRTMNTYTVTADDKNYWSSTAQAVQCRDFDTLYFDNNIIENVKKHLDQWQANKDTYDSRGLLFKTGLLFHGVPGTGKTSIASAIATYLNCNMIIIDTSNFWRINISEVTASINADSNMYVILLDEVDAIFKKREDVDNDEQIKTTTKLLHFLDSANSPSNAVFVATTNFYDKLDAAVTRKGRFDKEFEVTDLSYNTAIKMCEGFGMDSSAAVDLLGSDHSKKFNPASLQADILERIKVK